MGASLLGSATAGTGGGSPHFAGPTVLVTDLVGNPPRLTARNAIVHAPHVVDPNPVNPWGVAENGASPFWVSDDNHGVVTLYSVTGANGTIPLVVSIPTPGNPLSATGTPTGAVFNMGLVSKGFPISGV